MSAFSSTAFSTSAFSAAAFDFGGGSGDSRLRKHLAGRRVWPLEGEKHVNTVILQPVPIKALKPETVIEPVIAKTAIAEAYVKAQEEAQALLQRLGVVQKSLDQQIKEQRLQVKQIKAKQDFEQKQARLVAKKQQDDEDAAIATILTMLL